MLVRELVTEVGIAERRWRRDVALEEQRLECGARGQAAVRGVRKHEERRRAQSIANQRVGLDVQHHAAGGDEMPALRETHRLVCQRQHDVFEVRLRECGHVVIRELVQQALEFVRLRD